MFTLAMDTICVLEQVGRRVTTNYLIPNFLSFVIKRCRELHSHMTLDTRRISNLTLLDPGQAPCMARPNRVLA